MQKKFLSGLFIILLLNLLIKPFWILGVDRAVQNIVGAADYGFYFAIFNFSFLFNIFLDVGLTNFNNRNIAQNHHLLNKYFSGILGIKILLSALYIVITIAVGFIVGYNRLQMNLLYVLAFNQVLVSLVLYLRSNISGLQLFKTDSLISVLDRFLMILFCSVIIWGHWFDRSITIYWFVFSQTIAYAITAIVAFIIVVRKAHFIRINWNSRFFMAILKQSFPYALLVLLMTFYNRIDSVMIERLLPEGLGDYQAGVYASAYRLLDAVNMIAYLFAVILLPVFARMIKLRQPVNEIVKMSFSMLFTLSTIVAFACIAYRQEIMTLLNPQHANETLTQFYARIEQLSFVFSMLMSCFIAISMTYVFGTLLTANGSLRTLNIVAAAGMIMNIGLNLFLIPRFLASGSAVASVVTQFAMAIIQMVIAIRLFKVEFKASEIVRVCLFITLLIGWLFALHYLNIRWDVKIILFGVISLFTAMTLKVVNIKSILHNFSVKDMITKKQD
jgi:O-antigen/teichoic acid export membrane protein